MKAGIDSTVVIIVSILFLIVSGLSRRKKKKPSVRPNTQDQRIPSQGFAARDLLKDTVSVINDPFARLEKMLDIQEQSYQQEGESMENTREPEYASLEDMTGDIKGYSEVPVEKESQSLEVIVDEVADFVKEKKLPKSTLRDDQAYDEHDLTYQAKGTITDTGEKPKLKIPIFADVDDLKKAVIYSEILARKEY